MSVSASGVRRAQSLNRVFGFTILHSRIRLSCTTTLPIFSTQLDAKRGALDAIRSRIASIDMFCKFSSENGQGSAELDATLLRRLADQGIDLIIDLYPPS